MNNRAYLWTLYLSRKSLAAKITLLSIFLIKKDAS